MAVPHAEYVEPCGAGSSTKGNHICIGGYFSDEELHSVVYQVTRCTIIAIEIAIAIGNEDDVPRSKKLTVVLQIGDVDQMFEEGLSVRFNRVSSELVSLCAG